MPPSIPGPFDWSDLYYFLAVARAGRLTVAARRLNVDHTTVSRRIAALEAALGTRLFNRTTTGYTLTPSGEQLLASAEDMESIADTIDDTVGGADLAVSGTVRIGAPEGFGGFLAPRLGLLRERHPGLELELITIPRTFSLSKREADIVIGLSRPQEGRVHARKLCDYELGIYASADYLRKHAPITGRADLPDHPFIGYVEDFIFSPQLDYIPLVLKAVRPAIRASSIAAQALATLEGAGLCILPRFMAAQLPNLKRVLRDEVRLVRAYWLITHADVRALARVRATADFIVREVELAQREFIDGA